MKNNDFNTWERVFVACVNGKVAGFCTLAEKDELPEEYQFTPFIGFVFVYEPYRGNRLSELMIQSAILYAREITIFYKGIMPSEKVLDFPVDCNFLTGSVNL